MPAFLRHLKTIRVFDTDPSGIKQTATYFVMPDYLAVGSDSDFFRVPITPETAIQLANQFEASLITVKISDDLFAASELKLRPSPLTKDRESSNSFWEHHRIIENQFGQSPRGQLVSGIKKDVVLTNRLGEKPHKVALYGWPDLDGRPIQPIYVGHADSYVDYSHGIRLMARRILIDDQPADAFDVLKDTKRSRLLSNEGPIDVATLQRMAWPKKQQ
jgi:hypothetical protein